MKTVLFDLDGTLTDSIPVVLESFRHVFSVFKTPYPGDDVLAPRIGSSVESILGDFFSADALPGVIETRGDFYLKQQDGGKIGLFPGVRDGLFRLKEKDVRMGVVSTKLRRYSEPLLSQLQILPFFDVIIGSEDVRRCKPDPEPLIRAAASLGESVFDCVYIGDSLHDANAAANAGMPFVGVSYGTGKKAELECFGKVYDCLSAAVEAVIDTHS